VSDHKIQKMSKITLLTLSPDSSFLKRFYLWFKKYIKNHIFPYGGPQAVLESLIRGFNILNINYQLNPKTKDILDIVCVISGVDTLRWAIKAKKQGKIKKIIAGPNIIITPEDADGVLLNEAIDLVIVPSQWVKDFYASFKPGFDKKIRVWPAGVKVCPESKQERKGCLIYKKSVNEKLFKFVIQYLKSQNIDYKIIKYGKYKKEKYFELLNKVRFAIFLSGSESQGLALQEAWMRDVPTLAWNKGYFECKKMNKKIFGNVSTPYLTKECGMFFKDKGHFKNKYNLFVNNLFNFKPRKYSLENFTDKITSGNYLKIVNELIENYGK